MSLGSQILLGVLGGALPDILRIIRNRYDPGMPAYFKSIMFYVGLLLCMIVGAVTAVLLEAASVKEALAYGFGAPEILTRVLSSPPPAASTVAAAAAQPRTLGSWWWV